MCYLGIGGTNKYKYKYKSINRHKFPSTYQIVVSKEFCRFFDAVRSFSINSAPESSRFFGCN